MSHAEFDLILLGASGFVGALTARYLAEAVPTDAPGLRVALAGRSDDRVREVAQGLPGEAAHWPILTVDVTDADQVRALVGRTRALATTVGPYLVRGLPLVQACAEAGVHYADLTGETLFVHRSISLADSAARRTGARIVHSCGFDAVPSDLGLWLAAQRARSHRIAQFGAAAGPRATSALVEAELHVRAAKGGFSGGTIDSMRQQVIEAGKSASARAVLADRYALTGGSSTGGSVAAATDSSVADRSTTDRSTTGREDRPGLDSRRYAGGVRHHRDTGRWSTPFVMGGFNGSLIHRSNALLTAAGRGYGTPLAYREVMDTGRGARGALIAAGASVGLGGLAAAMSFGPTRALVGTVLPRPGTGPSDRALDGGMFRMRLHAVSVTGDRYAVEIGADLDPGYRGTAVMLGQSALALVAGEGPDEGGVTGGGVLTPASAFGGALVRRLRAAGFTFEAHQVEADDQHESPGSHA